MILELKLKNFRSYREEVVFSMEAESSKQKMKNVFEVELPNERLRILKSALIYGANGSGKTHIIKAFFDIIFNLLEMPKVGKPIHMYQPFLFDVESKTIPTDFELTFIGPENIKYKYSIKVLGFVVLEEQLDYFPNGKITNLFSRRPYDELKEVQIGVLGDSLGKKEISIFANQLLLGKFGDNEPHELLTKVYRHLTRCYVMNALSNKHLQDLRKSADEELFTNPDLQVKLGKLLKAVDTKIESIKVFKRSSGETVATDSSSKEFYQSYGTHQIYDQNGISTGQTHDLNLMYESKGSQTLYALGTKILSIIENGGALIVDEMDTSLHPFITKLIVMLFQSEKINKQNAQLIFTTHDVSLLDQNLIRRDQVWFAEKSDLGLSELYSLQDFEQLREDTPFEKWYMAGKFGALPNIENLESIF